MMETLLEKHIELIEAVNNSRTQDEHDAAEQRLNGFRDALGCMNPRPLHLIECDQHYLMQGIDRPMCCGVWLDWVPNAGAAPRAEGANLADVLGAAAPDWADSSITAQMTCPRCEHQWTARWAITLLPPNSD